MQKLYLLQCGLPLWLARLGSAMRQPLHQTLARKPVPLPLALFHLQAGHPRSASEQPRVKKKAPLAPLLLLLLLAQLIPPRGLLVCRNGSQIITVWRIKRLAARCKIAPTEIQRRCKNTRTSSPCFARNGCDCIAQDEPTGPQGLRRMYRNTLGPAWPCSVKIRAG